MSAEEAALLLKIKNIILDYGKKYRETITCAEIIRHIEEGLNCPKT
jgi:hypothetical protein